MPGLFFTNSLHPQRKPLILSVDNVTLQLADQPKQKSSLCSSPLRRAVQIQPPRLTRDWILAQIGKGRRVLQCRWLGMDRPIDIWRTLRLRIWGSPAHGHGRMALPKVLVIGGVRDESSADKN